MRAEAPSANMRQSNHDSPPPRGPGENEIQTELSSSSGATLVSLLHICQLMLVGAISPRDSGRQRKAGTFLKIRLTEAIFALIAMIVLFNVYTIRQDFSSSNCARELTENRSQLFTLRNCRCSTLSRAFTIAVSPSSASPPKSHGTQRMGHPLALVMLDSKQFGPD